MALRGALIVESLRRVAVIDGVALRVHKIARGDVGDPEAGQPLTWTVVEFEADDADGDRLVDQLQAGLAPGPWYCDFRSDTETFVVFSGCVFRYARGDRAARGLAEEHGRRVGVPEAQLDWPE